MYNVMLLASALHTGGAERVIAHLVRRIDRSQFRIIVGHLMSRGKIGDELACDGFEVVGVKRERRPVVRFLNFINLNHVLREYQIDLVHTHTHYALAEASLSRLTLRRPLKVVHTFHFGNYPHLPWRYLALESMGSRIANGLVAVGVEQAKAIRSSFRLKEDAVQVIVNGAEPGTTPIDDNWKRCLQQTGAPIIGTICTFIEQKGLPDLVKVAALLKNAGCNTRFVVVGDGPMRPDVEAQCRAQGLDDYVLFTGMVHGASSSMLPLFDVFFQPSLWEAMSMVVIEAMAAGKPVVATDVGDNRHVVEDGRSGRIVRKGDVQAMADALQDLLASEDLRRRYGDEGRRRYEARYTVETMTRAYERQYEAALRS